MNHLGLFEGIGGFALAARRAGFASVQFVEIEPFCQKVLRKKFPNVPIHSDIRDFDATVWRGGVDLVTGGFPCQPYSCAGERRGEKDDRALWGEMRRVISECQPTWVVAENVVGLLSLGIDAVLSDLEGEGYETGTFVLPACAVHAPHRRDRVWIVAHTNGNRWEERRGGFSNRVEKWGVGCNATERGGVGGNSNNSSPSSAHSNRVREQQPQRDKPEGGGWFGEGRTEVSPHPTSVGQPQSGQLQHALHSKAVSGRQADWLAVNDKWREIEPTVGGGSDGLSRRVDRHRAKRIRALGNSIVPQVAFQILQAIKR